MAGEKWYWWAGTDDVEYRLAGPCKTRKQAIGEAYGDTEPGDVIYLIEATAEDEENEDGLYQFIKTRNASSVIRGRHP